MTATTPTTNATTNLYTLTRLFHPNGLCFQPCTVRQAFPLLRELREQIDLLTTLHPDHHAGHGEGYIHMTHPAWGPYSVVLCLSMWDDHISAHIAGGHPAGAPADAHAAVQITNSFTGRITPTAYDLPAGTHLRSMTPMEPVEDLR